MKDISLHENEIKELLKVLQREYIATGKNEILDLFFDITTQTGVRLL